MQLKVGLPSNDETFVLFERPCHEHNVAVLAAWSLNPFLILETPPLSLEGAEAWPLRGQKPDVVFLSASEGGPVRVSMVNWMLSNRLLNLELGTQRRRSL